MALPQAQGGSGQGCRGQVVIIYQNEVFLYVFGNLRLEKEIAEIQQEIDETEAEIGKEERKRAREGWKPGFGSHWNVSDLYA